MSKTFRNLLNNSSEMRPVLNQAQSLLELQQLFKQQLPAYLGEACSVLSLQQGKLKVAVPNATVASKLKQLAPEIVQRLQALQCPISQLQVKVQLDLINYRAAPPFRQLGPKARFALTELADNLADSPLKQALKKLNRG